MAVIKRGILGGFQNKIGNVVGSSWKGIATMRALPVSVANPRTAPQVNQRNKFSRVAKIASRLLPTIVKPLWDRFAQQESGYNAFIRENQALGDFPLPNGFDALVMSKGVLTPAEITSATANPGANTVTVNWNNAIVGDAFATDRAYVVLRHIDTDTWYGFSSVAARSAGTATITLPFDLQSFNSFGIWLAFRTVDGTKVSNDTFRSLVMTS